MSDGVRVWFGVSAAVRHIRDTCDLTRPQIADLVNVPHVQVWRWETGRTIPKADSLLKVVNALGYDLALIPREVTP